MSELGRILPSLVGGMRIVFFQYAAEYTGLPQIQFRRELDLHRSCSPLRLLRLPDGEVVQKS